MLKSSFKPFSLGFGNRFKSLKLLNEFKNGISLLTKGKYEYALNQFQRCAFIYENVKQNSIPEYFLAQQKIAFCQYKLKNYYQAEKNLLNLLNQTKQNGIVNSYVLSNFLAFLSYIDILKSEFYIDKIKHNLIKITESHKNQFLLEGSCIKYSTEKKNIAIDLLNQIKTNNKQLLGIISHNKGIMTQDINQIIQAVKFYDSIPNKKDTNYYSLKSLSLVELCNLLQQNTSDNKNMLTMSFQFLSENAKINTKILLLLNKFLGLLGNKYADLEQSLIAEGLFQKSNDFSFLKEENNKIFFNNPPLEESVQFFTHQQYGNYLLSQEKRAVEGRKLLNLSSTFNKHKWYAKLSQLNYFEMNL